MSTDSLSELRISNDGRDDAEELRRRLEDDGYLFFRRLLDPLRLLNLRRELLICDAVRRVADRRDGPCRWNRQS